MNEMVERVAKALHAEFHAKTMGGRAGDDPADAWTRGAEYGSQDEWRDAAREAIKAMREPTEAMITEACWRHTAGPDGFDDLWRTMIDAALKE